MDTLPSVYLARAEPDSYHITREYSDARDLEYI